MKPPALDYLAPRELSEAVSALAGNEDAKVLAGGQSLVPLLSFRLAFPELLVDLRSVGELKGIEDGGDRVRVGAMVTQREAEGSELLDRLCPLVGKALAHVAHPQIRSRGTVGGSIAHADPAAEMPAVLAALGAGVRATGPGGSRSIPAAELFLTTLTTTLAEDEVLTAVELPAAGGQSGSGFSEIARRRGDYALCGAAAQVELDGGTIGRARIAFFGVADRPVRGEAVESALEGCPADQAGRAAAEAAAETLQVRGDPAVSEGYRRQLAAVVARRAIDQAVEEDR